MNTVILADVHLKVNDAGAETREAFVRFLRKIDPNETERVIILGDLFDFWFEYRHVIFSGYFEVLCALHDLQRANVKLDLICGNHDFWAGRFLKNHLNIDIHPDQLRITLGNQKLLFIHGDGINPKDWVYRFYKKFARNPLVVAAFRLIHPDWAIKIAQAISHRSRALRAADDPAQSDEAQAIRAFAERELAKQKLDAIICGHSHHPEQCDFDSGTYYNTGDWLEARTYLIWDNDTFTRAYYEDV